MFKTSFLFIFFCSFSMLFAKKVKVGLCVDNITTDRWALEIKSIENGIRAKGGSVFVKTALGSFSHQEEQVNDLINTQKIDVLILVPTHKTKCAAIVTSAQEKGVKVILYSRNVEGAKADALISFNPFEIGVNQAKYVINKNPNTNIILLGGPLEDLNSEKVETGQLTVFDTSSVNIIANTHVKSWSKKKAYDKIKELNSTLHVKADIVIAGNDLLAAGVIKYYDELNTPVKVIGLDAELKACQRIANDKQEMSIYLDIKKSAYCAALTAMQLGTKQGLGIKTNGVVHQKVNGVNIYMIESTIINKENLSKVSEELHLYSKAQIFNH